MLSIDFPDATPEGNEQKGNRPAVIVAVPDFVAPGRFPGLIVVPFSSQVEKFDGLDQDLYPLYVSGMGGLTVDSIAIIDQVRYIDQGRIVSQIGRLTEAEFEPIQRILKRMLAV